MERRSFLKILAAAPVALKMASDEMVKEALALFDPHKVYFDMASGGGTPEILVPRVIAYSGDDFGWGYAMTLLYPMRNYRGQRMIEELKQAKANADHIGYGTVDGDEQMNLIVPG